MFLQVPIKLERYINEIKRNSIRFNGVNQIALLPIGKTKTGETFKQMFMIYNPYQEAIRITPNFFLSSNKIYKMYPSEFELGADTVSAFVLFITEDVKVHINDAELLSNLKGEISTLLENSKHYGSETEQVEIHRVHKFDPVDFAEDKTISLEQFAVKEIKTENFKVSDQKFIDTKLSKIITEETRDAIEIIIENKKVDTNFAIKGISLKLFDDEHKIHVTANEAITLKAASKKAIRIYVNKLEFSLLNQEKMQMKVTIL